MKKQSDVFSEMVVGAFMMAVLALLAYFTIIVSGVDLFENKQRVDTKIVFEDIGGLKERDNVIYRGMKVGTVKKITLGDDGVTLVVDITRDVVLRDKYRIGVATMSLLGGNYLLLEEGTGEALPLDTYTFKGDSPTDWMRDLGDIARRIRGVTEGGGLYTILTNVEEATESAKIVLKNLEEGKGTMGKLLSEDESIYQDIKSAVADLKETANTAKGVAERLEKGEGTVGKLLSADDTVYQDLKKTLASASEVADRISKGEGTVGKFLSSDDTVYQDLKAAMADIRSATARMDAGEGVLGRLSKDPELADNASKLLANLEKVSDSLAKGDGTLGRLATDDELYTELSGLMKDVRQIVDNYRDTTPFSTFGSLIMGGL